MLNHNQASILPLPSLSLFRMSGNKDESNRNEEEDGSPPPAPVTFPSQHTFPPLQVQQNNDNDDGRRAPPLDDLDFDFSAGHNQYPPMSRYHASFHDQYYSMAPSSGPRRRYGSPPPTAHRPSFHSYGYSYQYQYIEAHDASMQADGNLHGQSMHPGAPTDEEIGDLQRISSLRSASTDNAAEGEHLHQFPTLEVDSEARMPSNPPDSDNHDTAFAGFESLFSMDGVNPNFLLPPGTGDIWRYFPPNSTPIQPSRYAAAAAASPTAATMPDRNDDEDSDLDRKPAADMKPSAKAKGRTPKTLPKKKGKPKKRRSSASRKSNGSSSSSSPGGTSTQGFNHIQPDDDDLEELTTDRARLALRSWYQRLRELYAFREKHGHTEVPQKYDENKELGVWVNKQRMEMKALREGKRSSLTPKKIEKLEEAGFIWAKPKGVAAWEKKYDELQQYIHAFGDPHVPTKFPDNRALGRWVSTQRNMYKKYKAGEQVNNLLPQEIQRRIRLLENLGFSWSMAPSSGSDENNEDSQDDDANGDSTD